MVGPRARVGRSRREELTGASLVLVIDAIPWSAARQAWEEGHLPGFCEPVPSVSVFPSFSNVAVPALIASILGARPSGYEMRYHHPPSGTMRGGPDDPDADRPKARYRSRPQGSMDLLAAYLVPHFMAWREIGRLLQRFVKEEGSRLAYASATDGVAHFGGREALLGAFRKLARQIVDARRAIEQERGAAPAMALTSDHGMAFGPLTMHGAGEATITWRNGRYRYEDGPGDPLRYARVWTDLRRAGAMDADGCVDRDILLTATWAHDYPDALHRIHRALIDLVEFPAPVLFSMRPGHTYGPLLTHAGSTLLGGQVGTHGGLGSEQSLGFLSVAGLPAPPTVVRAEAALFPYRDLVIRGAEP